ncbi:MAG: aminodeoxychorismate/anthranilate synthase component II [Cytophagaceae bacterium]|nr:aminodeoxychorismate/anthranilate synthase component II [Cytophagaceae bacterium]MDW8457008.1 aminodeoxychorismate/anthranilate synthase component II [Cytophagaceae bacterium]
MAKILMIDNYDSFTYNLVHIVRKLGYEIDVYRNDKIQIEQVDQYDKIILSPGPGIPSEAGLMLSIISRYAAEKSILGVCLGHQGIGEVFGGRLVNLSSVYHGVATPMTVTKQDYIFSGLPSTMEIGRYHSWVVDHTDFPNVLEVTAVDENGHIMALRHKEYDVRGVQFHPESILTPHGETILKNWLEK